MKMKTIIKLLFVFSLPFIFCRCADDGIHYEREINVPEGIYLTGSASQFSVEAINGKMNVIKEGTLVALNTWLTSSGDFLYLFSRTGWATRLLWAGSAFAKRQQ